MNKLQTLLIILTVAMFFTACEKDEITESYDCISGVITAGENVTPEDFSSIEIVLGKLINEADTSAAVHNPEHFDFILSSELKDDGSFTFENLGIGSYILKPSTGFIFAIDTFCTVTIDGKTVKQLNKIIERGTPENVPGW